MSSTWSTTSNAKQAPSPSLYVNLVLYWLLTTESHEWPATLCARPDPEILAVNGIVLDIDLEGTYHIWIPFNCADCHDK